jgi:hypothetical protein
MDDAWTALATSWCGVGIRGFHQPVLRSIGEGDWGLSSTLGCKGAEVGGGGAVLEGPTPAFPPAWWVLAGSVKTARKSSSPDILIVS